MKDAILTPDSSVKSSTTMETTNSSEMRDNFYFPGCRRDANCDCDMCIASINATRDLMPQSNHRSSLTKHSVSRPAICRSPVSFPAVADLSTPKASARIKPLKLSSSHLSPKVGSSLPEKVKRGLGFWVFAARLVLWLILVFGVDFGTSWVASRVLKTRLSPGLVRDLGEYSKAIDGLSGKFVFLKNELEGIVGEKVDTCSSVNSVWKINQDGLLLNSRCILYKSLSEEVSIWGWPLQTSGLLTAEHSFRSLTILSGRITEWSTGEPSYFPRTTSNHSSWTQEKWRPSVMQLDPNTWILEYRQSFFLDNPRIVSTALDLLRLRLMRRFVKLKQGFWLPLGFTSTYFDSTQQPNIPTPT